MDEAEAEFEALLTSCSSLGCSGGGGQVPRQAATSTTRVADAVDSPCGSASTILS